MTMPPSPAPSSPAPSSPAEPARIAFVITELEVGGAERCLTHVVLGLDRARYDPVVYSLWHRPVAGQTELVDRLEAAGIPVRFVGLRRAWELRSGIRRLQRFLQEQQPHLVQTFLFHANILGVYAGWRNQVPHLVQGLRVADRSTWRMMMERTTSRLAERIVCVSESVKRFAEGEAAIDPAKLLVIPNGVELPESASDAHARPVELTADRRWLVVVGRLHSQKGIDWLLPLIAPCFDEFPEVSLAIAGRGPEEGPLRDQVRALGLESRVVFLGWQASVWPILAAAELLLLPSRWEGMPNVLLEAMGAGLPVVATQVEGVEELLGPDTAAQTTLPQDAGAFAARVREILRDPKRAQDLGQRNRARVAAQFSLKQMVARYDALYRELLGFC